MAPAWPCSSNSGELACYGAVLEQQHQIHTCCYGAGLEPYSVPQAAGEMEPAGMEQSKAVEAVAWLWRLKHASPLPVFEFRKVAEKIDPGSLIPGATSQRSWENVVSTRKNSPGKRRFANEDKWSSLKEQKRGSI
ncbi:hypothetical protein Y1Q_0010389 [Alligator mississippiensis]|uniref:Uncharacterized protein n=1 Tax=Alligator mississippiensis TaxID=8496 RepID=A0A151MPE6_ALLMI|nr:hypothetical protein Y1Q_0010389 [Alligator mississippiensis]